MSEQLGEGQITLFINDEVRREFDRNTKVHEVIAVLLEGEDGFLFLEEAEEPLGHGLILAEIGVESRGRVHAARCKRIKTKVEYLTKEAEHEFPPAATIKTVLEWALKQTEFAIDPSERPKFALFLPDQKEPLRETRHVGTFAEKGCCEVTFELAAKERPQG